MRRGVPALHQDESRRGAKAGPLNPGPQALDAESIGRVRRKSVDETDNFKATPFEQVGPRATPKADELGEIAGGDPMGWRPEVATPKRKPLDLYVVVIRCLNACRRGPEEPLGQRYDLARIKEGHVKRLPESVWDCVNTHAVVSEDAPQLSQGHLWFRKML